MDGWNCSFYIYISFYLILISMCYLETKEKNDALYLPYKASCEKWQSLKFLVRVCHGCMMNARTCFEGEFLTLFFSPSTAKSLIKIYIYKDKKMVRILLITKTNVVFDIIMNLWSCRFNYWFTFVVVLACKLVRKTRIGFHLITLKRGSRFNYISLLMIIKMN